MPGRHGMDLRGVRVGCLFGRFGVVYGRAADSGAAANPSRRHTRGDDDAVMQ